MTHKHLRLQAKSCAYPGKYVPPPVTEKDLLIELQIPLEGQAKPLVNIVELREAFVIELAAPGLRSDDFIVRINRSILSIFVLHKDIDHGQKLYRLHGFNYNCFKKDIAIPKNIDPHFISTVYTNGILYVRLPKSIKPSLPRVDRILVY